MWWVVSTEKKKKQTNKLTNKLLPDRYFHWRIRYCNWDLYGWYRARAYADSSILSESASTTSSTPSSTHAYASSYTPSDFHSYRPRWWNSVCDARRPSRNCKARWCSCSSNSSAISPPSKADPPWLDRCSSFSASLGSTPPLFLLLDRMLCTPSSPRRIQEARRTGHTGRSDRFRRTVRNLRRKVQSSHSASVVKFEQKKKSESESIDRFVYLIKELRRRHKFYIEEKKIIQCLISVTWSAQHETKQ